MKVSVCMITYGHEKYLQEAIEGVLIQECDFEVELIVANDGSPDGTDEIVKDIIANHPKGSWISYFKQQTNVGMMPNFIFALQQTKGKYIALCEGDDYWTDPLKLQKQVDFLEANPDYVLCFHKIKILKPNGELVNDFITKVPENYETQVDLATRGNYIHTPSVVFRNVIKEFPFEFALTPVGDYFLYMLVTEHGKIKYIDQEMAVYRYGVGIHSSLGVAKSVKNFHQAFVCLIGCTTNEEIKKIFYSRQQRLMDKFEMAIHNNYQKNYFLSNHVFFRSIKFLKNNLKNPAVIKKKLVSKF